MMKNNSINYLRKYNNKTLKALGICNIVKLCKDNNNLYLDYFRKRIIAEVKDILEMCKDSVSFIGEIEFYNKSKEQFWYKDIKDSCFIDLIINGINEGTLFAININVTVSKNKYKEFQEFSLNCTFINLWVKLNEDEQYVVSCCVLEGFEDCITCNVKNCEYTDLKDSERIFYDGGRLIIFDDYEYDELLRTLLNIQEHMYIRFRMKFYNMEYSFRYGSASTEYERFLYTVSDINHSQYRNDETLLKACKLIQYLYEEICQTRKLGKDSFHYILRNSKLYNFKTIYEYKWLSRHLKLCIFKKMGLLVNNLEIPHMV